MRYPAAEKREINNIVKNARFDIVSGAPAEN